MGKRIRGREVSGPGHMSCTLESPKARKAGRVKGQGQARCITLSLSVG